MCEGFMREGESLLDSVYGARVSTRVRSSVKGRKWLCVF